MYLRLLILTLCCLTVLPAQDGELSALEKQRQSVRKQIRSNAPTSGFFTAPWTSVAVATAVSPLPDITGDCDPVPETSLDSLIQQSSQREGVDARLVRAVVRRESGGKTCAVSPKGAQGLMQLMPATQVDLGVRDPFDPADNIAGGVKYLKQMLERYAGNTALALAAYNAGPQRVEPGGKVPDIPETQAYVMRILAELNQEPDPAVK